jgi:hypothetical protein
MSIDLREHVQWLTEQLASAPDGWSTVRAEFLQRVGDSQEPSVLWLLTALDELPDDAQRGAYLSQPDLLGEPQPEQTPSDQPFSWVRDDQWAPLSGAFGLSGDDWAMVLTAELDRRWSEGWDRYPAQDKQAWLDEVLAQGQDLSEHDKEVLREYVQEVQAAAFQMLDAQLSGIADECGLSVEDLREVLSEVSADDFADALASTMTATS